jgi:hypothetical protein
MKQSSDLSHSTCTRLRLISLVPSIRRTRGFRLYSDNGKRFLDMYCDGGRTILGKKPLAQGKLAKACIDAGGISGLPTMWENRLHKALTIWQPKFSAFRFYSDETKAKNALSKDRADYPLSHIMAFGNYRTDLMPSESSDTGLGLCILPLAPAWSFGIVAATDNDRLESFPPHDYIPTIKLALATSSLAYFLSSADLYSEKTWIRMDSFIEGIFDRKGPWLYPCYDASLHETVFRACLSRGILISPDFCVPSCIPGEYDDGEVNPLREIRKLI